MLRITNDAGEFHIEVLLLSDVRGPASVALTLYRETEASRELRQKVAAERRAMREFEQLPAGRPSKRDRRHNHPIPRPLLKVPSYAKFARDLYSTLLTLPPTSPRPPSSNSTRTNARPHPSLAPRP